MKWMVWALVVLACDSDCRSGNTKCATLPGGPPKIISAYVNDIKNPPATSTVQINGGRCDGTDPRMWGGGFTVHDQIDPNVIYNVRCIPDLLAIPPEPTIGDLGPFTYAVQFRVVFSTGLNGDLIEAPGTSSVADGVIAATAATFPVPINLDPRATYYDPAGADFKQGIYGTAPPGPAIELTPGETLPDGTLRVFGLPSGSATQICFDRAWIKDTAGNALVGSNCVTATVRPLDVTTVPGDAMGPCGTSSMCDQVILADLIQAGVTFMFDAPILKTFISDTAGAAPWLTINYQTAGGTESTLLPDCYRVTATGDPSDKTLPADDALIAVASFPDNPLCSQLQAMTTLPPAAYPITVTVKATAGMIQDQYGVPLPADVFHQFQIRATP